MIYAAQREGIALNVVGRTSMSIGTSASIRRDTLIVMTASKPERWLVQASFPDPVSAVDLRASCAAKVATLVPAGRSQEIPGTVYSRQSQFASTTGPAWPVHMYTGNGTE